MFAESSAALQYRLRCLAVEHGYVDAGERADVTATLKQRDWLIKWNLTSMQKTGGSIEHFLIDLRDSIGIVAGDRSTATTFDDSLRAARILQPGALPKEQAAMIRSERGEMMARVQMLEGGLRVEQLDHRAAKGKAQQLQLTADALTDEMTLMRDEMAQMRAEQADLFSLRKDNQKLEDQLQNVERERDELRKPARIHTHTPPSAWGVCICYCLDIPLLMARAYALQALRCSESPRSWQRHARQSSSYRSVRLPRPLLHRNQRQSR
jgi:hypothetical protein